jgi:hypothetical protein
LQAVTRASYLLVLEQVLDGAPLGFRQRPKPIAQGNRRLRVSQALARKMFPSPAHGPPHDHTNALGFFKCRAPVFAFGVVPSVGIALAVGIVLAIRMERASIRRAKVAAWAVNESIRGGPSLVL